MFAKIVAMLPTPLRPEQSEVAKSVTYQQAMQATGWQSCRRIGSGETGDWLVFPNEPVDMVPGLIIEAQNELTVPDPAVSMSPPEDGEQLVGLPVWFWVENFEAVSATASVPGVSVTATATPTSVRLNIVEPTVENNKRTTKTASVDCDGPGKPYTSANHDPWASSTCSHAFTWGGTATIDVTVTWEVTWASTEGTSGTIDTTTRTRTVVIEPQELEAVTD